MSDYESPDVQPFLKALDKAHEAQTRYDVARQLAAEGEEANVRAEHIRFQQFVIGLFKRLRPYIVEELPQYWDNAVIYDTDEHSVIGLKCLHHYQGAIKETAGFDGDEPYQAEEPVLLPPTAIRNSLDFLAECIFKLGFSPNSKKRRGMYNASVSEDDDADPARIFQDDDEQTGTEPAGD
jgi:hypothetical protein